MEAVKKIINKEIELSEVKKLAHERNSYNKSLWGNSIRTKMLRDLVDSALDSDINKIEEKYNNIECDHNVIIRFHESMLTGGPYSDGYEVNMNENGYIISGSKGEYLPNKKHVSYYCICGEKLSENDVLDKNGNILPNILLIDHFGHRDALKVGYGHFKATIDYIQYIAKEIAEHCSSEEYMINTMLSNLQHIDSIPEQFIRTKSK